jgi:ferredoxin
LAWVEAAGDARIEVADRGWCAGCPIGAGTADHPAAATLDAVARWLHAAGVAPAALPGIVAEPLPQVLRPAELPAAINAESLSRRGFFGRFADRARASLEAPAPQVASVAATRRLGHTQPEHTLRLAVLARLARRHGGRVSPTVLPAITIGRDCEGHGVCATACPTGALRLVSGTVAAGLAFDATRCVSCGLCARLCPERAIGFDAERCGPTTLTLVSRRDLHDCPECGAAHAGADALCPRCTAGRTMAFDLFSPAGPGRRHSRSSAEVTHHE